MTRHNGKRILSALCTLLPCSVFAKSGGVNYSWGADALASMHDYVVTMMLYVQYIIYAVAGGFAVIAAFQIYIKMNTGEDGITKHILTLVGACLFIIGATIVFPMMVCGVTALMAQTTAGDYSAGTAALTQVSEEIAKYVPIVVKLCYAIAGVVAVVGAISVYIAMNNEEQDVKKKIMMVVGACIFLIAAAQALPLFFGLS